MLWSTASGQRHRISPQTLIALKAKHGHLTHTNSEKLNKIDQKIFEEKVKDGKSLWYSMSLLRKNQLQGFREFSQKHSIFFVKFSSWFFRECGLSVLNVQIMKFAPTATHCLRLHLEVCLYYNIIKFILFYSYLIIWKDIDYKKIYQFYMLKY